MRVGIGAQALGSQHGGDETYIRNVVQSLAVVDPDGDYTLFLGQPLTRDAIPGTDHMRRVVIKRYGSLVPVPFSFSFPLSVARARIDVLHVQYMAPLLCPARIVVSVHDI